VAVENAKNMPLEFALPSIDGPSGRAEKFAQPSSWNSKRIFALFICGSTLPNISIFLPTPTATMGGWVGFGWLSGGFRVVSGGAGGMKEFSNTRN